MALWSAIGSGSSAPPRITQTADPPILIVEDANFTPENGVSRGTGTPTDPFVIEDKNISAVADHGIEIRNTSAHFVVQNVSVSDGSPSFDGIRLINTSNGRIERTRLVGNSVGVFSIGSRSIAIDGTQITGNDREGIRTIEIADLAVYRSQVGDNEVGIFINASVRVTVEGNEIFGNTLVGVEVQGTVDLVIERNNVSSNGKSIEFTQVTGSIVRENALTGFGPSVVANQVLDARIENNTMRASRDSAAVVDGGANVTFTGNEVASLDSFGVLVAGSRRIAILHNVFDPVHRHAVRFETSEELTLRGNDVSGATDGIALVNSLNGALEENRFSRNGIEIDGVGVDHYRSHRITPTNLVDGAPIHAYRDCAGLVLEDVSAGQLLIANCTAVRIANVTLTGTVTGILAAFVDGLTITDARSSSTRSAGIDLVRATGGRIERAHVCCSLGWGIRLRDAVNLVVRDSVLVGNLLGISAERADGLAVVNSSLLDNFVGLQLFEGANVSLEDNILREGARGFDLHLVDGGRVADNEISDLRIGSGFAIDVDRSALLEIVGNRLAGNFGGVRLIASSGVRVHHNDFNANSLQATDDRGAENLWDDGYPSGGNFWSDYAGWDDCTGPTQDVCTERDGLGDLPREIDTDSFDRYPLVPANPPNQPPILLWSVSPTLGVVGEPFELDARRSFDPDGGSTVAMWDFGDGTKATGAFVRHTYDGEGVFNASLVVTDLRRASTSVFFEIVVTPVSITDFLVIEHSAGFRVPVPRNWSTEQDVAQGGTIVELVTEGFVNATLVSIIVETDRNPNIREDDAYLTEVANRSIIALVESTPGAHLVSEPSRRTVGAGQSAIEFALRFPTFPEYRKVILVVSQVHQRFWIFLASTAADGEESADEILESMLAGFVITAAEPAPISGLVAPELLLGVIALLAGIIGVCLVALAKLLRQEGREGRGPLGRRHVRSLGRGRCPSCGSMESLANAVCSLCHARLPSPPFSALRRP